MYAYKKRFSRAHERTYICGPARYTLRTYGRAVAADAARSSPGARRGRQPDPLYLARRAGARVARRSSEILSALPPPTPTRLALDRKRKCAMAFACRLCQARVRTRENGFLMTANTAVERVGLIAFLMDSFLQGCVVFGRETGAEANAIVPYIDCRIGSS